MVVNWILVVNFLLYQFDNIVMFITYMYMLTPKYSRLKTSIILSVCMFPFCVLKFLMPLFSDFDVIVAFVNNLMFIMLLCILFKENIVSCVLIHCCITILTVLGSLLWEITPYADSQNWELGTIIGYIITTPILFAEFALLIWAKQFIKNRQYKENNSIMTILVMIISIYYIMFIYMIERRNVGMEYAYKLFAVIFEFMLSTVFIIILFMIFKKGEEQQQLERYKELEHQHAEAKHHYEMLLKRTEKMEKVRHDFYGQLTTARYIISQDKEKGMQMLAELQERLESIERES